jgi:hypothetical protein
MGWNFPLCWACAKIGYSLAVHARKFVTRWLSMHENWLLTSWAYAKIISVHHVHFLSYPLSPIPLSPTPVPVWRPLSPLSRRCALSPTMFPVLCLCSLSPVLCPLSHGSVPCLPSSVPCLRALLLVSRPLSPALSSRLSSLSSVLCTLSINCPSVPFFVALFHCSCPLLLCYPSSVSPSLVLCPLSFILARLRDFLKKYTEEVSRLRRWILRYSVCTRTVRCISYIFKGPDTTGKH